MKVENVFKVVVVGFLLGMLTVAVILKVGGKLDAPADRYTVAELTDAIATREATFAERAPEPGGQ